MSYIVSTIRPLGLLIAFGLAPTCAAAAQGADAPLDTAGSDVAEVVVYGRGIDLIGVARSGSEGVVGFKDFENRPLSRVGELVENVPGLIATQHSGTGKANQYFLRGFNLDHGTDLAGFVDGAPVNMRTHGHGQGYLDFNFLIPELVERIDYRKGPYFADVGDFSAAGTVSFTTAGRLPAPLAEVTAGSFGYYRGVAAGSFAAAGGEVLVGLEGVTSNGPWVLDEDLEKINGLVKYSRGDEEHGWSIGLSGYRADWTSTDQIPERAIDSGLIPRLGFLDPDLGGRTARYAATANWRSGPTQASAYALSYDMRLTSNFTYFLDDPDNGDEFQQRDRRKVFGGALKHRIETAWGERPVAIKVGGDLRYDMIDNVGLYRSIRAVPSAIVRQDEVDEYSAGLFIDAEIALSPSLRATIGLRGDAYGYDVKAEEPLNAGDGSDAILTPKFALAWKINEGIEAYANYGESFHSNDVRGATITIDPVTGDPADRVDVLSRARGAELGARLGRGQLTATLAAFYLTLDSELVFVGDAGSTEPNDASRRYGIETSVFWRPTDWLIFDGSAAMTRARFRGVPKEVDHIPGAVREVAAAGATAQFGRGFSGSLRVRHFGSAPLIEDGSVRSDPTTLVNLGAYYTFRNARLGLDVLNLFDARDADITYFYASRLPGEPADGVEDRHLHPVEPRQFRASLRLAF